MSADPFHKPSPGDPFHPDAKQQGLLLDAARMVLEPAAARVLSPRLVNSPFVTVQVKNTTSTMVDRGGCLRVEGVEWSPVNAPAVSIPCLTGKAVRSSGDTVAVTLVPLVSGQSGPAVISGLVACRVKGQGRQAAPSSEGLFQAGAAGIPLVWSEAGEDERWGLVLLGAGGDKPREIIFKVASFDPANRTALVDIVGWDYGFDWRDVPDLLGDPSLPLRVVEVFDYLGCVFDEPSSELFDRVGYARYQTYVSDGYEHGPRWIAKELCCKTPTCEV